MAELVLGAGTSHSPMLNLDGADWIEWGKTDHDSEYLFDEQGRQRTWSDRADEVGHRFEHLATVEKCIEGAKRAGAALDELAARLAVAELDAIVVVGDDQDEQLLASNLPPLQVYWGDTITNLTAHDGVERPEIVRRYRRGYLEDGPARAYRVHTKLAGHIIDAMLDEFVDVATSRSLPNPEHSMGHAFAFPLRRVIPDGVPIVPILLNTYNPPSQPRAARCAEYGRVLRHAIDSFDAGRVGVLASGGLSHLLVMQELDERVLDALERHDLDVLTAIPEPVLQSGTSEIKNWITVAAACRGLRFELIDYVPGYRTRAGSGVGLAFATWR